MKGGTDSKGLQLQEMVLIASDKGEYCVGVLVTEQYIMAPANCVESFEPNSTSVYMSVTDASLLQSDEIDRVDSIVFHEDYDSKTLQNNLAMIRKVQRTTRSTPATLSVDPNDYAVSSIQKAWSFVTGGSDPALSDSLYVMDLAVQKASGSGFYTVAALKAENPGHFAVLYNPDGVVVGFSYFDPSITTESNSVAVLQVSEYQEWLRSFLSANGGGK